MVEKALGVLKRARRLVTEDGKTEWILLRPEDWQVLVELLEDLADVRLMQEVEQKDEFIPWEEAERILEAGDVPD